MSLSVAVVTPEGIIVAGESRQTQVVGGVNRVASESGNKVFVLTDTVLAVTAGWAYLQPQGTLMMRNIASLMDDFKPSIPPGAGVQGIAGLLWSHFNAAYQYQISQAPASAVPAGMAALNFIVAGYDPGSRVGLLFQVDVPSASAPMAPGRTTNTPGPWWIGQADVVARIINGYDPRTLNLPFVKGANQAGAAKKELDGLTYVVAWNMMNLQDAIDFAVGMIQVTTTIQKFTAGIAMQLGAVAGVGGPIDVAVARPGSGVQWIHRKELHA